MSFSELCSPTPAIPVLVLRQEGVEPPQKQHLPFAPSSQLSSTHNFRAGKSFKITSCRSLLSQSRGMRYRMANFPNTAQLVTSTLERKALALDLAHVWLTPSQQASLSSVRWGEKEKRKKSRDQQSKCRRGLVIVNGHKLSHSLFQRPTETTYTAYFD